MPQYKSTIDHIKTGIKGFTIKAAITNIDGWEKTLEKVETAGVKAIVKDLESLKKLLQAEEIDGEKVKKLLTKLGKETVTIAGKSDSKDAEKIKQLGEALSEAAETEEEGAKS